jgi:RimJ/RimL family protein N-acetyltransferase
MIFETDFMKLYEELGEINSDIDLESIVTAVAAEVEKYDENGSNQNCLFSTWAVELQLRGENFLPRPVYSPRDPIFDIKGEELVADPEIAKISSKEDVETQVLNAGDGARFYCHVNWADSKGGHEFLLINDNDTVLVVDGQAGYIKELNKDKKYFDDINFENSYIVRFDNKEINQDILKYNDEDQIVEWDDELDPKLLEESFSNNNEALSGILDELSEFDYAFIDADGEELDDEDAMKAVVQSPDQLKALGKGVCTDFVEYTCTKLDEREIPHKVYDIACTDKDGDHPAHVFVVVEDEGKFLWLEAAWHSEAGIHKYSSLEELFEDIARKHCIYDGENYLDSCEIREIKKSLVGMSQEAIYDYVNTLPITWKAVEEGITEGLETLTYKDVSDVELFKEYADDILGGYGGMSDAAIKRGIKEIHFDGKLAGYIGFSEYEEDGHKCLGIGNFMIIERGKGLGSAVIQDVVAKHKNEYDLIYCFVDAKNDGAIRLYKKLGKVYEEDGPNDNGEYYVTFYDNGRWQLDN